VDYRTRGGSDLKGPFGSVAAGLARTDAAMHEWAGLVTGWLLGHTSELFPGPKASAAGCDKTKDNCRP
jgi:hypothetical protein